MPIVAGDIEYRLSGGAGNTDSNASLGGVISTTAVVAATVENMFANVGSAEATAGSVKYRCRYVQNNHGSLTWQTVVHWIATQTSSATTSYDVGLGTSGVNGVEQTVANEDTAPSAVTFTAPANKGSGLAIGDVPFGEHMALWVRRTVNAGSPAFSADTGVTQTEGDTAA